MRQEYHAYIFLSLTGDFLILMAILMERISYERDPAFRGVFHSFSL